MLDERELAKELKILRERVDCLVSFITESLTTVDVRLAKLEKEVEKRAEQTPLE